MTSNYSSTQPKDIQNLIFSNFRNKYIEKDLHKACIENLRLNTLIKDDSISPDMMIDCMQRLLKIGNSKLKLNNLNINVTNYYSILSDGTVCIPWNFKNEWWIFFWMDIFFLWHLLYGYAEKVDGLVDDLLLFFMYQKKHQGIKP